MKTVLEIKKLKKSYLNQEKRSVSVVNVDFFSLQHNQQVGIEGFSGSGKTTLLNLIAGILKPDSGEIIFQNENVVYLPEAKRDVWRAQHIGYVFQTFNLLQGYSALENVMLGMAFGKGMDERFALSLLNRVNLSKYTHYKPRQLSVGQQQRVAVARALANKPKLVLADEPTGNLDRVHADETISLIKEVCAENGAALLLVSHDPSILGGFKTIIKMSEINKVVSS